ncbi:sulfite exporter TauE/SafE family protein [Aquibacillus sediminis]|uniref:sulfite exporter TauE/SafE family protein n=1 Tax=Aquibacillus sediminis TaxID=2574734 RepID=UPI001108839F|nr:sulfite exporter TauE/SafE family protein [Aquibacillus sediminis]
MVFVWCLLIGTLAATVGSVVGLGGGLILVPSLLILNQYHELFAWATPQQVVGVSLVVMVFTALSASLSYMKEKRIDYRSAFLFMTASIPGGVLGSWLNQFVDTEVFSIYFGVLMFLLFFVFFFKKRVTTSTEDVRKQSIVGERQKNKFSILYGFVVACLVGILSGLFGIGGGSLMVPAMVLLFQFPIHIATATSMFMILFVSLISSITHISLGHVPWEYVALFIPGAWIGGTIGAKLNQRLGSKTVEWILRVLLIVVGIRLIWQGIG